VALSLYPAKGESNMNRLEAWFEMLDYSLNTKKKRHMAGGILLSISVLFGSLAFTVMTLKTEEPIYE
jgi:hypothetical protein